MAVLCHNSGKVNQMIVTYYTQKAEAPSEFELKQFVKNNLPGYMVPDIMMVSDMPLLVNGKVDRQTLHKWYKDRKSCQVCEAQSMESLPEDKRSMAVVVLSTAEKLIDLPTGTLQLSDNFFEIGGDSVKGMMFVGRLHDAGYNVEVPDFIMAETFKDVVMASRREGEVESSFDAHEEYTVVQIMESRDPYALMHIIADTFATKADMERHLTGVKPELYIQMLTPIWDDVLKSQESYVVIDDDGRVVSGAINFDLETEPRIQFPSPLRAIAAMLERAEGIAKQIIAEKGISKKETLCSFLMATDISLPFKENVRLMNIMEEEMLKFARRGNYKCIMTANASLVTQVSKFCSIVSGVANTLVIVLYNSVSCCTRMLNFIENLS